MSDMIQEYAEILILIQIIIMHVKTHEIPIYNLHHVGHIKPSYPLHTSLEMINKQYCFFNNKWVECSAMNNYNLMKSLFKKVIEEKVVPLYDSRPNNKIREFNSNMKSFTTDELPVNRRVLVTNPAAMINIRSLADTQGRPPTTNYPIYSRTYQSPIFFNQVARPETIFNGNNAMSSSHMRRRISGGLSSAAQSTRVNSSSNIAHSQLTVKSPVTMAVSSVSQHMIGHNMFSFEKFTQSLDHFERQFYTITFTKLMAVSPPDRQENGMSFVQSGFFLLLTLIAISKEVDSKTKAEIDQCIGFRVSDVDSIGILRHFINSLPSSSDKLKLRQSSRLMLWPRRQVSQRFISGAAAALMLRVDWFNGTETTDKIATILNQKVELDSGGAIHDTFDEDDVSGGVTAVHVSTLYVRGCWRAAPTVLNGTRPFRDAHDAPKRTVRMIRINDLMQYADLTQWDAQAIEISYATPGLTLLMLIPRGNSLRSLVQHIGNTSMADITAKMTTMRVAATVPLYTLRMTLLLPNKLQAMGIPTLVDVDNITQVSSLRLSHAVQRIMFWAEAGRNAYKDDGIEWDQTPDLEVVLDKPYIFFVRWRNMTLINGNFVL